MTPCSDAYLRDPATWNRPRRFTWQHVLCLLALPFVMTLLVAVTTLAIGVMLISDGLQKLFKQAA